jgi:hypothetical protein
MNWKPADLVFGGGTQAVVALYGRRIRLRLPITVLRFGGEGRPRGPELNLRAGQIGFVGHPFRDEIVLAFQKNNFAPPSTIIELMRGEMETVAVNWATFRYVFDIDLTPAA